MPFESLDIIVLILIVGLSILVLRISFLYAVMQSSSGTAFQAFGTSLGLGSAFRLSLFLSAGVLAFWLVVSFSRLAKIRRSCALLIWHAAIFAGIGLLAYGSYAAASY